MSILDIRTLVFTNMLAFGVYAAVITLLWRQARSRYRGIGLLALDMLCQFIGWFLIGLRDIAPDVLSIVLGNSCVVIGATLGLVGMRQLFGIKARIRFNIILLALFTLIHYYYGLIHPDLSYRNLNLSMAMLIIAAQCAHLLVREIEPAMRRIASGVAGVFVAIGFVSVLRILSEWLVRTDTQNYMHSGAGSAAVLIAYQLLIMLLAFQWALMINKLLLREVEQNELLFRTAFQSSPYAIIVSRLHDGLIRVVNEGYSKISGYSSQDTIGTTSAELQFWIDPEERSEIMAEVAAQGGVRQREMQFRVRDGSIRTVLYSGDLVDINGEPHILSSVDDISSRKQAELERERLVADLQSALARVRQLSGLLPICASCKRIRDDQGYWNQIEVYISEHSDADFSHGLCPECVAKLYPDIDDRDVSGV